MAEKTNSYQDYQDAQSQLLQIQAQQQANLQEARLMGQSQMATNNALNQAAQVAAQTVAMGNTTQPATFNPTTQAVLQQYGLGQPRVVRNQTRSQSTTPQHVTINNNTSNITNNNVAVPANIGGPLQGRPVQINPDVQMGTFKTWLSNVFAQQNAEAARRDREYEKRESALARNANKVLKKIGEIGGDIGKALDPRRATSSSVNTIKTLFTVLGIANLAKNWVHVAHKLDDFFKWLGVKGSGSRSEGDTVWDSLRKNIVNLLGGQSEGDNAEGVLIAIRRLFYTKEGEDSVNGRGIFNEILDRIKLELNYRFKSAGLSLEKYKDGLKNSNNFGDKLASKLLNVANKFTGALGAMINGFISGDASSVVNKINDTEVENRRSGDNFNTKTVSATFNKQYQYLRGETETEDSLSSYGITVDKDGNEHYGFNTKGDRVAREGTGITVDKNFGNKLSYTTKDESGKTITKEIDTHNILFNGMDYILPNTSADNLKAGNKADNFNFAIDLDSRGNIANDTAAFKASMDVIQALINQEAGSSYNFDLVISLLQRLDKYLEGGSEKRIPVCNAWPRFFPKKGRDYYKSRYYKLIPSDWSISESKGTVPNSGGNFFNPAQWSNIRDKVESKEALNNAEYILLLVPAAGPEDIGIDKVVYPCFVISRKELHDVIKRYMNLSEDTELKDLQGYDFQKNMRKAMYRNTAESIKNNESFKQQYNQKMNEFVDLDAAKKEYQEGKEALKEEEFRYEKAYDYFTNDTLVGQVLDKSIEKGKELYKNGVDKVSGFNKRTEFIDKLRPIILKELEESGIDISDENKERYADILLSQLALESGWGKKPSGKNNYGGIKAPTEIDKETGKRVPKDKEHAKEVITTEILNGNLKKYPKLRDRVVEEPYQQTSGRWKYKLKDWFKSYDSIEDFVDDYVNLLNKNWSNAMNGESDLSDEELIEYYASNLKKGSNGGSYYTSDVDEYTDLLNKIYKRIKLDKEKISKENNNESGSPDYMSELAYNSPLLEKKDSELDPLLKNMNDYSNGFNIRNAVETLRSNTNKVFQQTKRATKLGLKVGDVKQRKDSIGLCAGHVRRAIEAGGISTKNRPTNANGYIKYLPTIGFTEISGNSANQPGDISIEEATKTHPDGHAAMWDGYNWISDFAQRSQSVHKTDEGKLHKFRYTRGARLNIDYMPTESIRDVSSYEVLPEDKNASDINPEIKNLEDNNVESKTFHDEIKQVDNLIKDDFNSRFEAAINDFSNIISQQNPTNESGSGEENIKGSIDSEILNILNKILTIQTSIVYNTAATADEVRANTQVTAQQVNRPIETRGTSNSMLNNRMNSNYGG